MAHPAKSNSTNVEIAESSGGSSTAHSAKSNSTNIENAERRSSARSKGKARAEAVTELSPKPLRRNKKSRK
jgi:hypothetical protein